MNGSYETMTLEYYGESPIPTPEALALYGFDPEHIKINGNEITLRVPSDMKSWLGFLKLRKVD